MARLAFLIDCLKRENPRLADLEIPSGMNDRRDLFRALRNIRPPAPVSDVFLRLQDEELQAQLEEKGVVDVTAHNSILFGHKLAGIGCAVWRGDITRLRVDAIVNAANSQMLGCFHPLHRCIDNAIHSAAGVQLREECHRLMMAQGHDEPTGAAKITAAYNLPCRHVIHTVGPIIQNGIPTLGQQRQLASCYNSIMALADRNALRSVALCCISTGEFRFPNRLAARIAVSAVSDFFEKNPNSSIKQVIFNVFKDLDEAVYQELIS